MTNSIIICRSFTKQDTMLNVIRCKHILCIVYSNATLRTNVYASVRVYMWTGTIFDICDVCEV